PPFRHRLQDLTETISFYATAGDGQSDAGIARVVDAPAVVRLRLRYRFPGYMAQADEVVAGVSGRLSVPAGTQVAVDFTASKSLQAASLEGGVRPAALAVQGETGSGAATIWAD